MQSYCPPCFEVIPERQYTVSDLEQLSENLSFNGACIYQSAWGSYIFFTTSFFQPKNKPFIIPKAIENFNKWEKKSKHKQKQREKPNKSKQSIKDSLLWKI